MMLIKRLGILGALDEEVRTLRARMEGVTIWQRANKSFYEGELEGLPVVLSWADVGKVNAAVTAQLLIDRGGVEAVIFTGVAGAVSPELSVHDLVVASAAQYHDVDVTAFGYESGQVPRLPVAFHTDTALSAALRQACTELGLKPHSGIVLSGDVFIAEPQTRCRLFDQFRALAVEMEGAAVAQTCYLNNIPFALLRAISDQADGSAPDDFRGFSKKAAETAAEVISLLCHKLSRSS